jgi:hypothetical protein
MTATKSKPSANHVKLAVSQQNAWHPGMLSICSNKPAPGRFDEIAAERKWLQKMCISGDAQRQAKADGGTEFLLSEAELKP